jgi:hypothetical protein
MSELIPIPLPLQLTRAFLEYEREGKIFDLPKAKFFRGLSGLDTSVTFHGHRAANPVGTPAAPWLTCQVGKGIRNSLALDDLGWPRHRPSGFAPCGPKETRDQNGASPLVAFTAGTPN